MRIAKVYKNLISSYYLGGWERYQIPIMYGLQIVNFTPGTYSNADYMYPEMGETYRSTEWIYNTIMTYEETYR